MSSSSYGFRGGSGGRAQGNSGGSGGGRGRGGFRGRGRGGGGGGGGGHNSGDSSDCCVFHMMGECKRGQNCGHPHFIRRLKDFVGNTGSGAISGPVRAMTRHEQTRTLFFSDGAKVYLKQDDGQDCPFDLSVTQGVPGLIQIEALHAVGRWLLASYTSPLPAGQFPHPTAVPVGLVMAWDLASPPPFTPYLLKPSSTEFAAHKLAAPAINSVIIQNNPEPFIFTGSMDGSVKMWQFVASSGAFSCVAFDSANAHVRGVRSLVFYNGYLYSASGDRTIKVWSPETRTCVATIMPPALTPSALMPLAQSSRGPRSLLAGVGSNGIDQDAIAIDTFNYQNTPFIVAAYKDGSLRCFDISNPASPKVVEDPSGRVDGGTQGNFESGTQPVELTSMVHMPLDGSNTVEPAILLGYSNGFIQCRTLQMGLNDVAFTIRSSAPSNVRHAGHSSLIRALLPLPGMRFMSGGDDAKCQMWIIEPPAE